MAWNRLPCPNGVRTNLHPRIQKARTRSRSSLAHRHAYHYFSFSPSSMGQVQSGGVLKLLLPGSFLSFLEPNFNSKHCLPDSPAPTHPQLAIPLMPPLPRLRLSAFKTSASAIPTHILLGSWGPCCTLQCSYHFTECYLCLPKIIIIIIIIKERLVRRKERKRLGGKSLTVH